MTKTTKEIINNANVRALKRARLELALSRKDLAKRLGVSQKAIEKYENGRDLLSEQRLSKILDALEITPSQFLRIKRGKNFLPAKKREKKVLKNSDRRSYQKNITKECEVLRSMRKMKGISQDDASKLCGYSRATIGHIENGRIEISKSRIMHILACYGFDYSEFEENMKRDTQRDKIISKCNKILSCLNNTQLDMIEQLLLNMHIENRNLLE